MAKKIRIIPWLDEKQLNKQLKNLEKRQQKIKLDIDVEDETIDGTKQKMRQLSQVTNDNNSVFAKLKTTISNTFSTSKFAMTGYLAVLNEINKASHNAKQTIEDMDKAVTDLSVAMNSTRNEASEYVKTLNQQAINLKTTTKSVTEAADTWLRQGKTVAETEMLIKDSLVLSKVGKIESAEASNYLTSALNGYKLEAKDAISVIDKLTAVDAKSASEAGGLALSMSRTASAADMAGVSMDKLVAWLATVKETTRASDETVGNMMKSMLSRMNQVKVGKFIDEETGESLNDMEKVLNKVGIAMRDANGQFISSEIVLDELGKKFNEFDSITQRAIATQLGGTYQYEKVISLLSNYSKALEYAKIATASSGSAMQKFNESYMGSLEAKQAELQASFEAMVINSDMDKVYSGILSATTALVDFINKTNSLKGAFTALSVSGGIKAFLAIKTGINEAYISLNKFANALDISKKTNISTTDLDRLLLLTNGLSDSQLKLIVSSKSLGLEQKKLILTNAGLTKEEAKLQLQTWGMTTAQTGLTASTTTLANVFKSLWVTLASNPLFLVTTLVSSAVMAWNSYKDKVEEVRQTTKDSATTFKESSKAIEGYTTRYKELRQALIDCKGDEEATYQVKQQLLDLQTELNEKYGEEYGKLNLVTNAYKDQTAAIEILNKKLAETYLNENREGIKEATKQMTSQKTYTLSGINVSSDDSYKNGLKEVVNKYKDEGMYLSEDLFGDFTIHLIADPQTAYDVINDFETDLRNKAKELGNENLFDDVLDISSKRLNEAKDTLDNYADIYKQALTAEIVSDDNKSTTYKKMLKVVEDYNNAVANVDNPYNNIDVSNARNSLAELKSTIKENEAEWGKYAIIVDEVFNQADTRVYDFNQKLKSDNSLKSLMEELDGLKDIDLEAMSNDGNNGDAFDKLIESAKEYEVTVTELIDLLTELKIVQSSVNETMAETDTPLSFTDTLSQVQSLSKGLDQLDKIYADVKDKEGFDWASILNNDDFKEVFSGLGEDYENFIKVITSSPTDIKKCQQAFDNLAGAYIYNSGVLNDVTQETKNATIAMLEQMGVANATALVEGYLASQEMYLKIKTNEATVSIYDQISALISQGKASDIAYAALFELTAQEEIFANSELNVDQKIRELERLALAYGITSDSIITAEELQKEIALAKKDGASDADIENMKNQALDLNYSKYQEAVSTKFANIANGISYSGGVTTKNLNKSGSGSSSTKETKQKFDWTENSITNLENKLAQLNEKLKDTDGWKDRQKILKDIEKTQKDIIEGYKEQEKTYKSYYKEASKGISKENKKKIESGEVFEVKDYNQKDYDKLTKAQSAWQDYQEAILKTLEIEEQFEKETIDWGENSLTNLQNEIDRLNIKLENTKGWDKQLKVQRDIIKAQKELKKGYQEQIEAYEKEYEEASKSLSPEQRELIKSGKSFKKEDYDEDTYNRIVNVQELYQNLQEARRNKNSVDTDIDATKEEIEQIFEQIKEEADETFNLPIEKAEKKVEIFNKRIESLEKSLSSIDEIGDIKEIFGKQRKNYTKIYMEYIEAEMDAKSAFTREGKELQNTLKGETKATKDYIKQRILEGKTIDENKVKTDDTRIAVIEYNSALEQNKTAMENTKSALEDYTSALQEAAKNEIDRVINYYNSRSNINSAKQNRYQTQMDITEAKGYDIGEEFYQHLLKINDDELERLEKEREKVIARMEQGNLSEEAYWSSLQSLYDISDAMDECRKKQIEWNLAIEQIKWEQFDKVLESLKRVAQESNFMISLYGENELYDKDGNLTDDGLTVQALHAQNYNTYLAESEKISKEIKRLNEEIAKDPTNQILIDRRNELVDSYQDSISSAHSEKEAIIDLIKDAYEKEIEAMTELADKKKDLLDKEKALHDYQKSIRDKQTDITLLKKQIAALSLSTDRADIAKRLKLEEQLKEAEEALAEEQYQHSIDRQKEALDDAVTNYEEETENYLENEEKVFTDFINKANSLSTTVLENLKNKAKEYGYELSESIVNVWSNTTPITDYQQAITNSFTGIGTVIDTLTSKINAMYEAYKQFSEEAVENTRNDYLKFPDKATGTNPTSNVDIMKVKEILGEATGKNGAGNNGSSDLNNYLANLGYAMISREKMVELAQALGLSEIKDLDSLRKAGGTSIIQKELEQYLNNGGSVAVDSLEKTGDVSVGNQQKVIDLIQNADKYQKDRSKLSDLNQYIYDNYEGKWLTKEQMVDLAKYLGYSDVKSTEDINSSKKTEMLKKLKNAAFNDGGIIKKATGEDGFILANSGEGVLTRKEVKLFQDNIPIMNQIIRNQVITPNINPVPTVLPVNRPNINGGNTYITVQGNLDNVTVKQLKKAMSDVKQETLEATPSYMWRVMKKFGN